MHTHFFRPARHPLSATERNTITTFDKNIAGPPVVEDPTTKPIEELFQHINCGAVFVKNELVRWVNSSPLQTDDGANLQLKRAHRCPHCNKDDPSFITQMRIMNDIASADTITDEQRFDLMVKAIAGFKRNNQQASAYIALNNMLLQPSFRRLIDMFDKYGKSLVGYAISRGDDSTLLVLINCGANINTSSSLMKAPLHDAVEQGKPWAVSTLLQHGANPNATHYYVETPYQMAQRYFAKSQSVALQTIYQQIVNIFNTIRPVFNFQDDINRQSGCQGHTRLHSHAAHNNERAVVELLQQGADPNAIDNDGYTVLMHFAAIGYHRTHISLLSLHEFIIERNLSMAQENSQQTLERYLITLIKLGMVQHYSSQEYVEFEAATYGQVNQTPARREGKWIPTHKFQLAYDLPKISTKKLKAKNLPYDIVQQLHITEADYILQKLLQAGCDLSLRDRYGRDVYELALRHLQFGAIIKILEFDITQQNHFEQNRAQIFQFAYQLDFSSVQWLLEIYLAIAHKNSGKSLMHLAVELFDINMPIYNGKKLISALISVECNDINAEDNNDETPLFIAIRQQKLGLIELLAKVGADFNVKNNLGEFPYHIAKTTENKQLINLIREKTLEALEEGANNQDEQDLLDLINEDSISQQNWSAFDNYRRNHDPDNSDNSDQEFEQESDQEMEESQTEYSQTRLRY